MELWPVETGVEATVSGARAVWALQRAPGESGWWAKWAHGWVGLGLNPNRGGLGLL
jgi:hypothetical protein